MKTLRHLLSVLLCVFTFLCIGCSGDDHSDIRKAISTELDSLKSPDTDEAYSYLSQSDLFPDGTDASNETPSAEVKDVFSMFFKNFDYSIQSVTVSEDGNTATASVRLTTIDAGALSKDFASSSLREAIKAAAKTGGSESRASIGERYLLLNHLLKTGEYGSVESDCTIKLTNNDNSWTVDHTATLENQLVGGLVSRLADPYILTPEETIDIYLGTIRKMSTDELSSYLGLTGLYSESDDSLKQIYNAMVDQVHEHFNYKIQDSTQSGTSAAVGVGITSFNSDAIMERYHAEMDSYLATADAVIEGSDARLAYSRDLLLKCIKENTDVTENSVSFSLKNDGVSWKLLDPGQAFGEALFGTIDVDGEA